MTVYPNPVQEVLQVNLSLKKETDVEYVMTDITGRVVYYDMSTAVRQEEATIDIGRLSAGTYLVTIKTTKGTLTKRFVKL
ncbi:MAG: T9SS type A sorting domain-containing protein [Aureispira sp.]